MTDRDDDLDPADWLAQQFGEDPEPVVPAPSKPAVPEPAEPVAPPAAPQPPIPPAAPQPPAAPPPPTQPPAEPTPAPPIAPPSSAAPFQWGLTPGVEPPVSPDQPIPAVGTTAPSPPPLVPPVAPPEPPPAPPVEPADVPTQAFTHTDLPQAAATPPPSTPTTPPGQDLETVAFDARWLVAPVDSSIEGVTEVIEAELVGLATPEGEGAPTSAIDNLFGDTQFQDYGDQALIPALPPRQPPAGPRPPMPTTQKVLLWVAGGLAAVLAIIGLFALGTQLSEAFGPAPAVIESPTPTPTPSLTALPVGPVAPGEHQWDALLGGECLKPWESAWQDSYTVVDCATPHTAQMVFRGVFDDPSDAAYPGVEELQKRINLLCTPTTVIDYSKAGMLSDIQVSASFAADDADWVEGNRTYFCFVSRSSGQELTESVAVPQVAPVAG